MQLSFIIVSILRLTVSFQLEPVQGCSLFVAHNVGLYMAYSMHWSHYIYGAGCRMCKPNYAFTVDYFGHPSIELYPH
jgi:hypothetical protein